MYEQLSFIYSENSGEDNDQGKAEVIYLHQRTAGKGVGPGTTITETGGNRTSGEFPNPAVRRGRME